MPTSKEELLRRGLTPHEIQHNQHRRAEWQDYSGTGLYMITLCIEGRHPLFGHLEGIISAKRGQTDFPHIVLSSLGRTVLEGELPKIHRFYPQIEVWQAAMMPDHLHLLLYVAEPLPQGKKLGDIIRSFKGGCSRAWWGSRAAQETALKSTGTTAAPVPSLSGALKPSPPVPALSGAVKPSPPVPSLSSAVKPSPPVPSLSSALKPAPPVPSLSGALKPSPPVPALSSAVKPSPQRASLFEAGYHDRIIKRPGMLDIIKRYMNDNPLRALMRRQLPHLMERRLHLHIGTQDYAAFGALFLLKRAEKEQVFFHRRDAATGLPTEQTDAYKQERERLLAEAREGVVLVSPAISRGEKMVIDAAIEEGLPVIHLQKEPLAQYWKPELRRFEACARGSLLIMAPWGLDEHSPSDFASFHRLNDLAAEICKTTDAVLLNISDYKA